MVKSLLGLVQQVAGELAQNAPSAVLSATDKSSQQFKALAIAACEELADMHDWQFLTRTHTINTVAGQSGYALPADCLRLVSRSIYDSTGNTSVSGSTTQPNWAGLNGPSVTSKNNFRIIGNEIVFAQKPGTTPQKYTFDYISRNYVYDFGLKILKPTFEADSDKTVFNDRLLTNFIKLKWREAQGMDTGPETQAFNMSLRNAKASDRPAPDIFLEGTYLFNEFNLGTAGSGVSSGGGSGGTPNPTPDPVPIPDPGGPPVLPPPVVAAPGVAITKPTLNKASYITGENATASVNFVVTGEATTATNLKLIALPPGGTHVSGPFRIFVLQNSVPLPAGTLTVSGILPFEAGDTQGQWEVYGQWTDSFGAVRDGPSTYVSVTASAAENAALPIPAKVLATYFPLWGDTTVRITSVPTFYNTIMLFHAVPADTTSGAFKFEYGAKVNAADIDTCRARGQRVILTCGGAFAGFNFTNRTQSTNFVNSFKQMYTNLGGVDGCDFNNYEANVGSSPAEMTWISQQLINFYGPNFQISTPAHPGAGYAPLDRTITKAMSDGNALTYASPQMYDASDFANIILVKELVDQWVVHLGDASKVVIGLGANYARTGFGANGTLPGALNTAQTIELWNWAKGKYPTIRGMFGWSADEDRKIEVATPLAAPVVPVDQRARPAWDWGQRMGAILTTAAPIPLPTTTTAWMSPTTSAGGSWTGLPNLFSSNNVYATQSIPAAQEGATGLFVGGFNLGIPSTANIQGIEVRFEGFITPFEASQYSYIFLIKNQAFTPLRSLANNKSISFSATESVQTVGTVSDLWGGVTIDGGDTFDRTWTPADFDNTLNVFIAFGAGTTQACTVSVDQIQMRVTYTQGA